MNFFDALFVNPTGRTSRDLYLPALLTVLASIAFFTYVVPGRTSQFCVLVLLYPAWVLASRRLLDMGKPAWLLLAPLALLLANQLISLNYFSLGEPVNAGVKWSGLVAAAALALWGAVKK